MNKSFTLIEVIVILFILSLMVDLSLSLFKIDMKTNTEVRIGGEFN